MPKPNPLHRLIHKRRTGEQFGYGVTTADRYLKRFTDDVGLARAMDYLGTDLGAHIATAKRQLVFCHAESVLEETKVGNWESMLPKGIAAPPNTLLVMRHVVTTPREDRDTDVLHTSGGELDPKAPLLWQHIPPLIIGKVLAKAEHTDQKLSAWTALLDMNDLTADAAKLIEADALRFSHGFRALDYRQRKREGQAPGDKMSFDILRFEIMEVSLVSVPSNVDAEIELYSKGALRSDAAKAHAAKAFRSRRKQIQGGLGTGTGTGTKASDQNASQNVAAHTNDDTTPGDTNAGTDRDPTRDPTRWNRQLSKHFDVERQHVEPSNLEYDWVSRYLGTEVKQVHQQGDRVSGARLAPLLKFLEDELAEATVVDTRNITGSGREVPPVYETMRLNSSDTREFLIYGLQFLKFPDGRLLVLKREPTWSGLHLTVYASHPNRAWASAFLDKAWERCRTENPLKGECFTLGGEFLERGTADWGDVFLTATNANALQRAVGNLNAKGANTPARGTLIMGPPGTGKTATSRVLMAQAKTTFLWVSARDMYRMGGFAGFTAAFEIAQECAPSIVFFEDIDAALESRPNIDLLKTTMDGLKSHRGTLAVLATNHPEALPKALIDRPGRFHDVLEFHLPDKATRRKMLDHWYPSATEDQREAAADWADGWSGAHLRELCDYATTIQESDGKTPDDALAEAMDKVEAQRKLVATTRHGYRATPAAQKHLTVNGLRETTRETTPETTPDAPAAKATARDGDEQTEPSGEKAGTEKAGTEKAGRVISAKNLEVLRAVLEDIEALKEMKLPRAADAICDRCARRLADVIKAAKPQPEDKPDAAGEPEPKAAAPGRQQLATAITTMPQGDLEALHRLTTALIRAAREESAADIWRAAVEPTN